MEEQKKIAIEMWQCIKAQITQNELIYGITWTKKQWLDNNYPGIRWNNFCLLCDIYLHEATGDNLHKFECPDCPLTKKYKEQAVHGCVRDKDTPWARIVKYDIDEKAAIEACDEIIKVIESL